MTTHEPWIGPEANGTGTGCRQRWGPGWPPCGAPVTIHVLSESAIDGVICLQVCEPHAQTARDAGVYREEHSPSYPGCRCEPTAKRPDTDVRDLPYRPEERLRRTVRAPYDPALAVRLLANSPHLANRPNIYIHYPIGRNVTNRGLCGSSPYEAVNSTDWRLVSCPDCRTTKVR